MNDGSRREVTIAGLAAAAAVAAVSGLIAAIPELNSIGKIVGVAVIVGAVLAVSVPIAFKEARRLVARRDRGEELTAYTFEAETGILLKGKIPNVSLRVATIQATIDTLVEAVPEANKAQVLHNGGYAVGQNWAREFSATLWHNGLRKSEVAQQLLRWGEYDATAGMGRLIVAMQPDLREGTVLLLNSFLSKTSASFPLNHWFAGYIAGTVDALLDGRYEVTLQNPTKEAATLVGFHIRAVGK